MLNRILAGVLLALATLTSASAFDIKSTTVPGRVPPALGDGEIGSNRADGRFFYKSETGAILGGLLPDIDESGYLKFRNGLTLGRKVGDKLDVSASSILLARGANTLRSLEDRFGDLPISVLEFAGLAGTNANGLRSCGANAGAAFQGAADKRVSQGGGIVTIPNGLYCIGATEEIAVNGPVSWLGEGRGLNSGAGYLGGTLVRTANPTGDVFKVRSRGGAKFRDFAIDGYGVSGGKTAGAYISLAGDDVTDYAASSEITGMHLGGGGWDAIRAYSSINWSITSNNIIDFKSHGIFLSCEGGSNPDGTSGHLTISGNLIWAFSTQASAIAGVQYQCGGDVRVASNKILGAQRGVRLYLTRGNTGTLQVIGNSIEEQTIYQVVAERAPGVTAQFGNFQVNSNQLSILETGRANSPFLGSVHILESPGSDVTPWITNVTVNDNVLNHGIPKAIPLISFQAGNGVTAAHNVMTNLGNTGAWGFDVGGSARKVSLIENEGHDIPAGMYNTVRSAATVRDAINKLPVSTLGPFADGSEVYTSDGLTGSAPLLAGGTGSLARRVGGAWRSAEQGDWLAYAPNPAATSGTITTLGSVSARRQINGKTAQFSVDARVTTNGTATGNLTFQLPGSPATGGVIFGKEVQSTGKSIVCSYDVANPTAYCTNVADQGYPAGNNTRFLFSGTLQIQ